MSGVAVLQRQRRRDNARPWNHHTKDDSARHLRNAALALLRLPGVDEDGREAAGKCLDRAGELLTSPRCGWYPRRPVGWRP